MNNIEEKYYKTPQERDNVDLLELVCQLHSRALNHPSEKMHNSYTEARTELEKRLKELSPASIQVTGETSDGYHTFNELYEFRKVFNAALFNEWTAQRKYSVHKSVRHSDGEYCFGGGWFIVVAVLPGGQISNHYELKDWDLFNIPAKDRALFHFDGHTANDVIERLKSLPASPVSINVEQEIRKAFNAAKEQVYPNNPVFGVNKYDSADEYIAAIKLPQSSINVDEAAEKLLTDFPFDGSIETFAKMVFKSGAEWQSQQTKNKQ